MLLSGGLDSAVNLAWAVGAFNVLRTLTFDYGQRAARQEIAHAENLAKHYRVNHETIALPFLAQWTNTALVNPSISLPVLSEETLDKTTLTLDSAKAVWVPNRNGIFINIASAIAERLQANVVIVGFNREEGATFPDNSADFVNAANRSLFYSTLNHVEIRCTTLDLDKSQIVGLGIQLNLPFSLIWSCYEGDSTMCGACESCLRLKRAAKHHSSKLLKELAFAH